MFYDNCTVYFLRYGKERWNIKDFFAKAFDKVKGFFTTLFGRKNNTSEDKRGLKHFFSNYKYDGKSVNWKKAVMHSLSIVLHVLLRAVSYIFNILMTVLLVCMIAGVIVGVVFIMYLKTNIDPRLDIDDLRTEQDATSKFFYYNENGEAVELEEERIHGSENRIWASSSEIPDYVKDAFVAIEDHRFWDHQGVDWYRTLGAVKNFFIPSGSSFGGSTITQQLVKNLTGEDDVTIQRKVQEIFRALYVEKQHSKDEILELYLNTIYLSQGCSGVKTAAFTYFGKDVSELSLVEAAALASITKYPTKYDPVQHPENNLDRRNTVLKTMYQYGMITEEEFDEAYDAELVIDLQKEQTNNSTKVSSYYVDAAIEDIISDLMSEKGVTREIASNMLYSGGYNVYLAVDPEVQRILEECYVDEDTFPPDDYVVKPQSAMVVCHPTTGDVLGIVGGRGEKVLTRGLNYATQTRRSPGSSIKPLAVYSPAVELGLITYGTVIDDIPVQIVNGVDWPKNNSRTYQGLENIAYAVLTSLNTTSMRVLRMVGVERSWEFTQKLGLTGLVESYTNSAGVQMTDKNEAPLALGATTIGVTVREMASAYTTFTNGGIHNKARTYYKVTNQSGDIILDNKSEGVAVFSEDTIAVMTRLMQNVAEGRDVTLSKKIDCAGKTGTSEYDYDKWFCGFTPYYVAAVWYGFEQPKTLPAHRKFAPIYIFDIVMTKLHETIIDEIESGERVAQHFDTSRLMTVDICASSGMLYNEETCGKDPRHNQKETGYYIRGTEPTELCTRHILVDSCTECKCVASPYCPNTEQVALVLETKRAFPVFVYVTDAQYIYRPLGDAQPFISAREPFFKNTVAAGVHIGITRTSDGYAFNRYCSKHSSGASGGDDIENGASDTTENGSGTTVNDENAG